MTNQEYWEQPFVKSMSDFRISRLESNAISQYISESDDVLDIGCGDGEGSFTYRDKCKSYTGIDRSLEMLSRFQGNYLLLQEDIAELPELGKFSVVVSQRCIINLEKNQEKVLSNLKKYSNKIILCEAFQDGYDKINFLREILGCSKINKRWHNDYLTDDFVKHCLKGYVLKSEKDFSVYYLLTRVLHSALTDNPKTESKFNEFAEILQNHIDLKGISTIKVQLWQS